MKLFDTFWARIEQACYLEFARIVEGVIALSMIMLGLNITLESVEFYQYAGALRLVPIEIIAGIIFATNAVHFLSVLLPRELVGHRLRLAMMWVMAAEVGVIAAGVSHLVLWGWTIAAPVALIMTVAAMRLSLKNHGAFTGSPQTSIRPADNLDGTATALGLSKSEITHRRHDSREHRALTG